MKEVYYQKTSTKVNKIGFKRYQSIGYPIHPMLPKKRTKKATLPIACALPGADKKRPPDFREAFFVFTKIFALAIEIKGKLLRTRRPSYNIHLMLHLVVYPCLDNVLCKDIALQEIFMVIL